jgi:polygalacturonase
MHYQTVMNLVIICSLLFSCTPEPSGLDIKSFGASTADGINNQESIQKAIDKCASSGGGTVIIPSGRFYTGAVLLKSNVELRLETGAVLMASPEQEDYVIKGKQFSRLIVAENATNIIISGNGIILGTGEADGAVKKGCNNILPEFRPGLIEFNNIKNLVIENILLKQSDFFALTLNKCEDVRISGVTIQNNYFHPNSDGIDPGECRNVIISDCNIIAGDDCICFKNGGENIIIDNCILSTPASAIKFGTNTSKEFRKISVSNCIIYNSMVGIGIYMKDGGTVSDISFSNITIEDIQDTVNVIPGIIRQQAPIFIDIDKRTGDSPPGTVKNIRFSNISINSYNSILIQGMKKQPVQDLYMNNIFFTVTGTFDFSLRKKPKGFADRNFLYHEDDRLTEFATSESYLTFANITGAVIQDVFLSVPELTYRQYPRNAAAFYNVDQLYVGNIQRNIDPAGKTKSIIRKISSE